MVIDIKLHMSLTEGPKLHASGDKAAPLVLAEQLALMAGTVWGWVGGLGRGGCRTSSLRKKKGSRCQFP